MMNDINDWFSYQKNTLKNQVYLWLSVEDRVTIEHELLQYEHPRAGSIEALKMVQSRHGWVPDEAIAEIALFLGIDASDVEGVATFYSQIFRQPVGRHVIRVCDSMTCFINGHETILDTLKRIFNLLPGQTTEDGRFTLLPACCLGHCDKGPAFMIDDNLYGSDAELMSVLETYR